MPEEIIPKEAILITPEELVKLGWKKMGGAWYGPANKKLTNFDSEFQTWIDGKSKTVKYTFEL